MSPQDVTIEAPFPAARRSGAAPDRKAADEPADTGRVPRVARLMALAIRFERLICQRTIRDYAELARMGQVSRARITQIMNLLVLAPDIQEEILFLPAIRRGRDPIRLARLQPIAQVLAWPKQRVLWAALRERSMPPPAREMAAEFDKNRLEVGWPSR